MDENEAKKAVKEWLEKEKYIVKEEVKLEGGLLVPDFFAYKEKPSTQKRFNGESVDVETIWVEVKGDNANLTDIFGDLLKLSFVTYFYGGKGILAISTKYYNYLRKKKKFLNTGGIINVIRNESLKGRMDTFTF